MKEISSKVGLVEIGSRSIRYLIADFGGERRFNALSINTIRHDINLNEIKMSDIVMLNNTVSELYSRMIEFHCDVEFLYGTEICRKIQVKFPGELDARVRVLKTSEEALGSWAAGLLCENNRFDPVHCIIVDEGNGSTEIAIGEWSGSSVSDFDSTSFDIGSAALAELFERDPANFADQLRGVVESRVPQLKQIRRKGREDSVFYIGGSAATKAAWLKVRSDRFDHYDPAKVNGVEFTNETLLKMYEAIGGLYVKDKRQAIRLVDDRCGSESEASRLISSIPYFILIESIVRGRGIYRVTGYGLRHGIGFLISRMGNPF